MQIWCINLKDNRDKSKQNKNTGLKFQICRERCIVAIGWSVCDNVNTWEEYKHLADAEYANDTSYAAARNGIQSIKSGDLVWVRNPVTREYYLVEITDEAPSVANELRDFDICGYRRGNYYSIPNAMLTDALSPKMLSARRAVERIRIDGKRNASIKATELLFDSLKRNRSKDSEA